MGIAMGRMTCKGEFAIELLICGAWAVGAGTMRSLKLSADNELCRQCDEGYLIQSGSDQRVFAWHVAGEA